MAKLSRFRTLLVVTFLNPLGFLALLGLPAVVLIHFLQRQARVIPSSTLFLLEQTQRESTSGNRFDRLTNSVPLWMQLLMVLLLTWLLVQPRYHKPASTQQVAIVLDSSASMSVFKEKLQAELTTLLPTLQGPAARLQLYLLESDPAAPVLYSGTELEELLASLNEWQPTAGAIDPMSALRLARSRIRREGILIYGTDSIQEEENLPFEAQLLAVGEPTSNLGFTGLSFDDATGNWQATVRNYSDEATTSSWQLTFPDGTQSDPRPLNLAANALTTLTGPFPTGVDELTVTLAGDQFALDDILPIIRPQIKKLSVHSALPGKFSDFQTRFLSFFPNLESVPDPTTADLALTAYDPLFPILPETNSIITINESARSRKFLSGGIVVEQHPLMRGLTWQALQSRETIPFPATDADEVLLWQGQRPLILLRQGTRATRSPQNPSNTEPIATSTTHLVFNFDLTLSNALKLPSTVILLHRFTDQLRTEKVAFEALNTEIGQPLELAKSSDKELTFSIQKPGSAQIVTKTLQPSSPLFAPAFPCTYTISQNNEPLLQAANHFADTREADLRETSSLNNVTTRSASAIEVNTAEDHLWPLWVLLALTALLISWHFIKERTRDTPVSAPTSEPQPEH